MTNIHFSDILKAVAIISDDVGGMAPKLMNHTVVIALIFLGYRLQDSFWRYTIRQIWSYTWVADNDSKRGTDENRYPFKIVIRFFLGSID